MARTIQELAKEALQIQDGCNLSGLVHGWSRAITELREALPDLGTDGINRHPINALWIDKLASLNGRTGFTEAYLKVCDLADGKEVSGG
jgi:hypothetical protein